ncbi:MAG: hypothetical protein NVS2B2_29560 [Ktedonobacteraceae bacterium]
MSQQSEELLALPNFDDDSDEPISPIVRPRRRRRNIIIATSILLLLVLLAVLLIPPFLRQRRPTTYQYQKVTQGPFFLTVSATGPLQSGMYNVVFSGTGKLTEIDVKVGQKVTEGQVLAKLDKTSLLDALNQAKAAVDTALVAVGNGQAGLGATQGQSQANNNAAATAVAIATASEGKTLSQSQASIAAAETTLTNDQTNVTNVQAQSQASINAAETTLTNDQTNVTNVQAQSQASINAAQTALTNDQTNVTNVQAQSQATINTAYTQEQQAIATCNAQATATTTPTPSSYDNCIQLAQNQYNQAVATANANTAAAQAKVTSDQQQVNTTQMTAKANNDAAQAKVNADMQQLTTAQTTAKANNSAAQAKIIADQQQLAVTLANTSASNTTAQNQVSTSQSQLKTSQANAGLSSTTQQNQVNTAQSQLQTALLQQQTAQHNLDNITLKAPHAGIVTTINGTVGGTPGASSASSGTTPTTAGGGGTFIQLADNTALQVQANVNESDVANLQVGDEVQFTVSAYANREFHGTVNAISPNGQTVSNVVTYPVTIDLDMNNVKGAQLFPGMTVNAVITVVSHPNTLLIPVGAVNFARLASGSGSINNAVSQLLSKQDAASAMAQARQALATLEIQNPNLISESPIPAYVIEHLNGKFVAKPIVLGLTDETVYEVLQGLSADETIVVGVQSTQKGG